MNGIVRSRLAGMTAVLLVCVLLISCFSVSAMAYGVSAKDRNIVLVVDASGSLSKQTKTATGYSDPTDPDGCRYDAVNLFLGLLPDEGDNCVGAVVFDDEIEWTQEVSQLQGESSKYQLYQDIRSACETNGGGDTNIGAALEEAVAMLAKAQAENGYDSVIVLMTDGVTDMDNDGTYNNSSEDQAALADEQAAIADAATNGIEVYTVWLNANGETANQEVEAITDGTGGKSETVTDPSALLSVYELFYNLIFNLESDVPDALQCDENGDATGTIFVPAVGVTDLKIVIREASADVTVSLEFPDGTVKTGDELNGGNWNGQAFTLLSVPDPERGTYTVTVHGEPNQVIEWSLVYDNTIGVELDYDRSATMVAGDPITFTAELYEDVSSTSAGTLVTDAQAYTDLEATLYINDSNGNEIDSVAMTSSGTQYTCTYTPQSDGSYTMYVKAGIPNNRAILSQSDNLNVTVNAASTVVDNQAPVVTEAGENPDTVTVWKPVFGSSKTKQVDLVDYFSDPDGDPLTYYVQSAQSKTGVDFSDAVWTDANGSALNYDKAKVKTGTVTVYVQDPSGAQSQPVEITFKAHSTRNAVAITAGVVIIIGAAVLIALAAMIAARRFKGIVEVSSLESQNAPQRGGWEIQKQNSFGLPGGAAADGPVTFGPFRGKRTIAALGIPGCMLDRKAAFSVVSARKVMFKSKMPFFTEQGGVPHNQITMALGAMYYIYDSQEGRSGIKVELKPQQVGGTGMNNTKAFKGSGMGDNGGFGGFGGGAYGGSAYGGSGFGGQQGGFGGFGGF